MRVYTIKNDEVALQLIQLFRLNAECTKLHWSRKIKGIPQEVMQSLEIVEDYVEKKVEEWCSGGLVGELTEEAEDELMVLIKSNSQLRTTIGTGVILAGKQNEDIKKVIEGNKAMYLLQTALATKENVIIF